MRDNEGVSPSPLHANVPWQAWLCARLSFLAGSERQRMHCRPERRRHQPARLQLLLLLLRRPGVELQQVDLLQQALHLQAAAEQVTRLCSRTGYSRAG